jgi:Xaa-Pro aminopeptidase
VGSFLNVHEGPHAIGTRISHNDVKLQAGMSVSNEPVSFLHFFGERETDEVGL